MAGAAAAGAVADSIRRGGCAVRLDKAHGPGKTPTGLKKISIHGCKLICQEAPHFSPSVPRVANRLLNNSFAPATHRVRTGGSSRGGRLAPALAFRRAHRPRSHRRRRVWHARFRVGHLPVKNSAGGCDRRRAFSGVASASLEHADQCDSRHPRNG